MLTKIKRADKRARLIILSLFLLAGGLAYSLAFGYGLNNNSDGLVLDIDFSQANYNASNRTFTDRSGNGNHAVSTNPATFVPDRNGKSGGAMNFATTNDEVVIANNASYKTNSVTVSFWYRPQDNGNRHVIFTTWTGFTTEINSDRTFKWGLNGLTGQYFGTRKINWNEWVYITATFDHATKLQCTYFNGVQQECQTVSGSVSYGSGHLYLSGSWAWIKGDFGNVKVYNRALSAAEVKAAYGDFKPKAQFSSLEKGLIGYWPLDSNSFNVTDNQVIDRSAYSNNGTNTGAALSEGRAGDANGSMSFNENLITFPSLAKYNLSNSYSYSFWIYYLESKRNGVATSLGGVLEGVTGTGSYSYHSGCRIRSTSINVYYDIGAGYNSQAFNLNNITSRWSHITVTYDGNTFTTYQDGLSVGSLQTGPIVNSGSNDLRFGTWGGGYRFIGKLSEVRIYNRALSADEVGQLYSLSKPKIAAKSLNQGLILDLPLTSKYTKGGSAGSEIMTDLSAYSHDGQNFGGVVSAEGTLLVNTGNRVETNLAVPNSGGTISVWYKPTYSSTDVNRNSVLYSTGNSWVSNSFELALRGCCGNPYDNVLYMMASNNSYLRFEWDGPTWEANQWINLTIVYDSRDYIKPYVNGELQVSSMAVNSADFNFPAVFNIGARNAAGVSAKGTVSYLKVYNRPLSAAEIKTLYEKGRGDSGAILSGINN